MEPVQPVSPPRSRAVLAKTPFVGSAGGTQRFGGGPREVAGLAAGWGPLSGTGVSTDTSRAWRDVRRTRASQMAATGPCTWEAQKAGGAEGA